MPRHRDNANIPGLTTAYTAPFVLFTVTTICLWLVIQQGFLSPIIALILGGVATTGLIIATRSLYASLVDQSITRPGCLLGLIVYGGGFALLLLVLAWMFWTMRSDPLRWAELINIALLGVIIVPILSFGAAFWQSRRESNKKRSGLRPRRRR